MSQVSLPQARAGNKLTSRAYWKSRAKAFITQRLGIFEASPDEFLAGYVDAFRPVYVRPGKKVGGEFWYVWFIFPGEGKAARVVNKLLPGLYVDHEGNVIEHESKWTLILGTVTRIGKRPLLSPEMFK